MAKKTVRILVAQMIGIIAYAPNDLVLLSDTEIKNRKDSGLVDDSKSAIAYCETELGRTVIDHDARVAEMTGEAPAPDVQVAPLESEPAAAAPDSTQTAADTDAPQGAA